MKNTELIMKILKRIKGEKLALKRSFRVNVGEEDIQTMTEIVKDQGQWCLSSDTWLLPLTDLTNRELSFLLKCI